jgi:signal transduction histidine kinase
MEKNQEAELQNMKHLESLELVAAGLAHDFNNLLQGILGNIFLAKMHIGPTDAANKLLGDAEGICMSAKHLTDHLLIFSKGGSPVKTIFNINDKIIDWVDPILSSSNISCDLQLSDEACPLEADESQIREVIENLLINAKEAMPEGGTVIIQTRKLQFGEEEPHSPGKGPYVRISVTDNGPGMPEENLKRIFDPYFSTKNIGNQKGMGLGLTICHSIIERHDGHITVHSEKDEGTTFDLFLPCPI